jgi:hypothetical protein
MPAETFRGLGELPIRACTTGRSREAAEPNRRDATMSRSCTPAERSPAYGYRRVTWLLRRA